MLLTAILITLITLIATAPFSIVFMAQATNQLGMLEGDSSGAPAYLLWIVVAVSFFTMTLMAFVLVWEVLVIIHLYGSIEEESDAEFVQHLDEFAVEGLVRADSL